jgi:hypothetical protein
MTATLSRAQAAGPSAFLAEAPSRRGIPRSIPAGVSLRASEKASLHGRGADAPAHAAAAGRGGRSPFGGPPHSDRPNAARGTLRLVGPPKRPSRPDSPNEAVKRKKGRKNSAGLKSARPEPSAEARKRPRKGRTRTRPPPGKASGGAWPFPDVRGGGVKKIAPAGRAARRGGRPKGRPEAQTRHLFPEYIIPGFSSPGRPGRLPPLSPPDSGSFPSPGKPRFGSRLPGNPARTDRCPESTSTGASGAFVIRALPTRPLSPGATQGFRTGLPPSAQCWRRSARN